MILLEQLKHDPYAEKPKLIATPPPTSHMKIHITFKTLPPPTKKINKLMCVSGNMKIGTVARKKNKSFYMGKIGKQYGQTGKSLGNPLKCFKNSVGGKKLGTVG